MLVTGPTRDGSSSHASSFPLHSHRKQCTSSHPPTKEDGSKMVSCSTFKPLQSKKLHRLYHCHRLRNRHPNTPHMELFGLLLPHWSGTGSPTFIPLGAFDPIVMVVGETYAFMSRRGLHLNTTYSSFYMYYRGKYIGMTMPMKDRVAPFLIYLA